MNEHTPGPWRWAYAYQCRGTHWCLENDESAANGMTIDHHLVTFGTEEYEYDDDGGATRLDQTPNFCLIAAAPDLLAACEAALADTLKPIHLQEPYIVIPMLKAAIARAKEKP